MSQGGQRKLAALALAYLAPTTSAVVLGRLTDLVSLWSSVLALTEESEGGECVPLSLPSELLEHDDAELTLLVFLQCRAVPERRGGRRRARHAGRLPVGRRGRLHRDARDEPTSYCASSSLLPLAVSGPPDLLAGSSRPQLASRDPIRTHPLKATIGTKLSEAQALNGGVEAFSATWLSRVDPLLVEELVQRLEGRLSG